MYIHILYSSMLSRVQLFATPWTIARRAPLSMGFSRQENRSGLPFPPPMDLPDPGIKTVSLASPTQKADSLPLGPPGEPRVCLYVCTFIHINTHIHHHKQVSWLHGGDSTVLSASLWQELYFILKVMGTCIYEILVFFFFQLEDNCFTMLCSFLLYNVNQLSPYASLN